MATYSQQWNTADATNMHSSNPEPLTWSELHDMIGFDPLSKLKESSLEYTSTQGNAELRELIVKQYHSDIVTKEDVVLTCGAQEGIFAVMNALLDYEDEVIGFTPCFEPLYSVAHQLGAQVSLLALESNNQWQIDWDMLEKKINHKTKLIVINFPHNPTGAHITESELNKIIDLCRKYDCWLFSDEVFRGLEHDTKDLIPAAVDLYDKAISMGVMSKSLALPGIRLGWLVTRNQKLVQSLMQVKSHLSICQSALDTQLALTLIPHSETILKRNTDIINSNKAWLSQRLKDHSELFWQPPKAAATGYIQLKNYDADEKSKDWLEKYNFMVMPGQAFLTKNSGFRLTLGKKNSKIYFQTLVDFN